MKIPYTEFYKDEKRQHSRELDFGAQWRDGVIWPTYRVTWIENTGEVYAIPLTNDNQKEKVEILAVVESEEKIEEYLKGWADKCTGMNSLDWVRNVLAD